MTDFDLVVLNRIELKELRKLAKKSDFVEIDPAILQVLAGYGFTEYQLLGLGELGGQIFGSKVSASSKGKRFLLFRKQQTVRRWQDHIVGFILGALLVSLAWVLSSIPITGS